MSTIYRITGDLLTAIGDAIRRKTGGSNLITPTNMPQEIDNIPTGGADARFTAVVGGLQPPNGLLDLTDCNTIRQEAFRGYTPGAFDAKMPRGMTTMAAGCFWASDVRNIDMGIIDTLPSNSLRQCPNLDNRVVEHIKTFKSYCCYNSGLTAIHIRESAKLEWSLFSATLTKVQFHQTPISIDSTAFSNCSGLTDIYVSWSSGDVAGAPWGATNATVHYDTPGNTDAF